MKALITGIQAETLTPFAYHSLMVQGGSATLPEVISDQAIMFGLAATLGMMHASVCLPPKDYRRDLDAMPWRASIFTTTTPKLLAPLTRRLNLEEEAGFKQRHYTVTSKGNFKTYFSTQEVPAGVRYSGALFGFDPFKASGRAELVIRIGLHRNGMVRLTPCEVEQVQLNAATAHLFGRELCVERYLLYGIQLTPNMSPQQALAEVSQWN
jgi:hypothetical protein